VCIIFRPLQRTVYRSVFFESDNGLIFGGDTLQIVYREDDSYLGYLSELMRSPFVMYPKLLEEGHQTDLLIGSDCAEFVIYGRRRLGYDIPYCGPELIYDYLSPQEVPMPGDILHYGSQVSVFYEDRGVIGAVDDEDIVLQSYDYRPYFTTIRDNNHVFGIFELYRWK